MIDYLLQTAYSFSYFPKPSGNGWIYLGCVWLKKHGQFMHKWARNVRYYLHEKELINNSKWEAASGPGGV